MNTRNFFRGLTLFFGVLIVVRAAPTTQAANYTAANEVELVAAIHFANGNAEADAITLTADITLTAALPQITSEVTIEGGGFTLARDTNAATDFSVLYMSKTGHLTLKNMMLTGGSGSRGCGTRNEARCGGGIFNDGGELILMSSTVSVNSVSSYVCDRYGCWYEGEGGGIYNSYGTLTVANSTIVGNSSIQSGGGISNYTGTVVVLDSIISGNSATLAGAAGGGISNSGTLSTLTITDSTMAGNSASSAGGIFNGGTVRISNSTISGNSALSGAAGGIDNIPFSTLVVTNSTISNNTANGNGSGIDNTYGTVNVTNSTITGNIHNYSGTLTVTNSIFAANNGVNCSGTSGTLITSGTNLADDSSCAGFTQSTSINLGPLQDNGGSTQTHSLLPGSSAINAAGNCTWDDDGDPNTPEAPLLTDQRGYPRDAGACDVGAFEVQLKANTNLLMNGDFSAGQTGWNFWGDINGSVSAGMLHFNRLSPGWKIATAYQTLNYNLPADAPLQIVAQVGNSSSVSKGVEIILRDPGWKDVVTCMVTVPPNTANQQIVVLNKTKVAWSSAIMAFRAYDPDGVGSITVDNVSVKYIPTLSWISGFSCSGYDATVNKEMVSNGDFSSGRKYWLLWGDYTFQINSGVMEFYRNSGATKNAVLFTDIAQHLPQGAKVGLSLDLGNSSAAPKEVEILFRDFNWVQKMRCQFTIPANQPLTTVTLRGTVVKEWGRPVLAVRALDADGLPAVRVDNVSLKYDPNLTTVPNCDGSALSANGLALSVPESTPEAATAAPTDLAPAASDPPAAPPSDPPANDPPANANDPAPASAPTDPPPPPAQPGPSYTLADLEAALACVTHGGASQALSSHLDNLPHFLQLLATHTANGNVDAPCADAIREIAEGLMQ